MHKNNQAERIKIIFRFSVALFLAFTVGICVFKILGQATKDLIKNSILLHFDAVLPINNKLEFLWHRTLRLNLCEFICIFSVLVFSFSFINRLVSCAALVFSGIKFGLFASAVWNIGIFRAGFGNSLCFWLLKGIMLILIYNYVCKISYLSLDSRYYSTQSGRVLMKKRTLLSMLTLTVYTVASLIVLGGIYCVFIYTF